MTPAVSQEDMLQRMSGGTDTENPVILQGRHRQIETMREKQRQKKKNERTNRILIGPLLVAAL